MKTPIILMLMAALFIAQRAEAQLSLTYPAGGETFQGLSSIRVAWNITDPSNFDYEIMLSLDGGSTYAYITSQFFQAGAGGHYHDILLPNVASINCKLMLQWQNGGPTNTQTSGVFAIAQFQPLSLDVSVSADTNVCTRTTTQLIPHISGGQPPYKLVWMGGQPGQSFENLDLLCDTCNVLNYYVRHDAYPTSADTVFSILLAVTDANGLTGYDSVTFFPYLTPAFSTSVSGNLFVACGATDTISLERTGGAQVVSYRWLSLTDSTVLSDSLNVIVHVQPGYSEYVLNATDQYGCTLSYDTLTFHSSCNTLPVLAGNDCYQLGSPDSTAGGMNFFYLHVLDNDIYDTTGNNYSFSAVSLPTKDTLVYTSWTSDLSAIYRNCFILQVPMANLGVPDSFQYILYDYPSPNLSSTAWVHINTPCAADSGLVWPGDADDNGYVDNADLLPIGVGYGTIGTVRPNATINWVGQNCTNWTNALGSGSNYKYIDCNGDGIINADDTMAVHQNFFLVHQRGSAEQQTPGAALLSITTTQDTVLNADILHATIILGDSVIPADKVYGIAFDISIDPLVIDAANMAVSFTNSFLGNSNELITLSKNFGTEGLIKAAVTRFDHTGRSGYGPIATADFIITTNNLNGKNLSYYQAAIKTAEITMVDSVGDKLPVNNAQTSVEVGFSSTGTAVKPIINISLEIYPNPASSQFIITSNQAMDVVRITDMPGQEIATYWPQSLRQAVDVSKLANGIYIAEIESHGVKMSRRIVIAR